MQKWTHYRALIGSLSRDRSQDDPLVIEARRGLLAARLYDATEKTLAATPALNREQRMEIAELLMAGGK